MMLQSRLKSSVQATASMVPLIDLREVSEWRLCNPGDLMRVIGPATIGGEFVEIVTEEAPLRRAMQFSSNILLLSLLISGITAALVYLSLHYLSVRPMRQLTANMMAFRKDPENAERVVAVSGRQDEIGIAEREARGHAARSCLDAAAEEPARLARACRLQDQP